MLNNTKKNFLEIWKDAKGLVTSTICLVKDTISIPIALCKDGRDTYLAIKKANTVAKKTKSKKEDQEIEVVDKKPLMRKRVSKSVTTKAN